MSRVLVKMRFIFLVFGVWCSDILRQQLHSALGTKPRRLAYNFGVHRAREHNPRSRRRSLVTEMFQLSFATIMRHNENMCSQAALYLGKVEPEGNGYFSQP